MLYVCYNIWVYQFETNSKDLLGSAVRVATYDGFMNGFHTFIEKPQIAPNGKIYICTGNSTRYLHTIEKPNEKGLACDLRQHSFRLKTFNTGVPHFPFYSLGADTCYTTSISSPRSEYEIKIYPNPANEYLTIKNESKTKEDLEIEIVDLLGKKVMSKKSFNEKIDIRNIENGVYFIMLKNKEGEIIYKEKLRISK
ncbi:MAG: T9SS type A sorting domain-containing protein [Chitinophagales bacterium]|nr:T9SS type A sorting domain-containing protein [Chitinophagales bacterium]